MVVPRDFDVSECVLFSLFSVQSKSNVRIFPLQDYLLKRKFTRETIFENFEKYVYFKNKHI